MTESFERVRTVRSPWKRLQPRVLIAVPETRGERLVRLCVELSSKRSLNEASRVEISRELVSFMELLSSQAEKAKRPKKRKPVVRSVAVAAYYLAQYELKRHSKTAEDVTADRWKVPVSKVKDSITRYRSPGKQQLDWHWEHDAKTLGLNNPEHDAKTVRQNRSKFLDLFSADLLDQEY